VEKEDFHSFFSSHTDFSSSTPSREPLGDHIRENLEEQSGVFIFLQHLTPSTGEQGM
jgi:hypothetical protein